MKWLKAKSTVARELFINYFVGYIALTIIVAIILLFSLGFYMVFNYSASITRFENLDEKLLKDYSTITEEELSDVNGGLIVANNTGGIDYLKGNVPGEFMDLTVKDFIKIFGVSDKVDEVFYIVEEFESMLTVTSLNSRVIKGEDGKKYSIFYKSIDSEKLLVLSIPYDFINSLNSDLRYSNRNNMRFIIVVDIILILGLLYLFAKITSIRFVNPIKKIIKGMVDLKEGQYGSHIEINTSNEFKSLADGFNSMSNTIKEEKEFNEKLLIDKNDLILHVSHDLKNPLASILGYSEFLNNNKDLDSTEREEYLNIILKNSKRANKIITDLFTLSLLSNKEYVTYFKKVDINELLREVVVDFLPEIESKGFLYNFDILEEEFIINADEVKIIRALSNILDNALKYNDKNTTLIIKSTIKDNGLEIIVGDNGRGISKEVRERIFEPFVREDKSRNSETGGTGLGLAITKMIIEKHNGSIGMLDSDKGTLFKINFKSFN